MENRSEVARLLARIEAEYEAADRALHGLAITAQHDFIQACMENIGHCQEQLQQLLGEQEALHLLYGPPTPATATGGA